MPDVRGCVPRKRPLALAPGCSPRDEPLGRRPILGVRHPPARRSLERSVVDRIPLKDPLPLLILDKLALVVGEASGEPPICHTCVLVVSEGISPHVFTPGSSSSGLSGSAKTRKSRQSPGAAHKPTTVSLTGTWEPSGRM